MTVEIITRKKGGPIDMSGEGFGKGINSPTAGDVHVNRPLTNFSQKYMQSEDSFIATRAFPNIPVLKQSDLFYEFDRNDFFRDDVELRADSAESAGSGFNISTTPYLANVWAYHKDVSDRQRANADEPVQPDRSATQFVTQKHLIRRERDWATNFFGTSIWTSEDLTAVAWEGAGTPIEDIRLAQTTVHGLTGFRPNKMVVGRATWDALQDNDELLTRITGGATAGQPAKVMKQLIAGILELDEIFVMDGVVNTAVEGAAGAVSFIGGDQALVYYAPDSAGLEDVTAGCSFSWTGLLGSSANGMRIKRFRMENLEADRIEGQMAFAHQVIGADLGFFFSNTVT